MSTITWLHLSDLHFREGVQHTWDESIVLRALLDDLREQIDEDGLSPDFIVVTGDLAYSGAKAEYGLAEAFFEQLLEVTGLRKGSLFVVPGNHDVDRSLISRGAKAIASDLDDRGAINEVLTADEDRRLLMRRFDRYRQFIRGYFGDLLEFDHERYFYARELELAERRVALLGLNSAWLCAGDEDQNHLALGERQVRSALEQASGADVEIALLHHPFDWLREFDRNDCEPLLMQGCDFLLHGHLHRAGMLTPETPDARTMVIAAGACYEKRRNSNSYNLVRLDMQSRQGTVHLRRYCDESGGFWTKDVMTYRNVDDGRYEFTLPGAERRAGEQSPPSEGGTDPVTVHGSGAVAQGPGATAAGQGGVAAGRDVRSSVIVLTDAAHVREVLAPDPQPPDLREAEDRYLGYVVDRHRYLDFKGMGVSDRVPLRLPLVEMFVPLKARIELPEGETWSRDLRVAGRPMTEEEAEAAGRRVGEPVPVLDLLRDHDGLIVLGDPGAGKTTLLKYLALRVAMGEGDELGLEGRLPVLVPLSAYANALANGDVPLDGFICQYYRDRGLALPAEALLQAALAEGKALLLLDGLDEVREWGQRRLVVDRVVDFFTVQRPNGNKFVLTSRIVGYREVRPNVEGLAECTLVDFDNEEVAEFVEKWTAALERAARGDTTVAASEAEREREELLASVRRNQGVRTLASNPLLLTILALMKRQGVALPERRVELYENYVQTLLKNWNLARGLDGRTGRDLDVVETVRVLAPLALWMHETSPGAGLAKREDVRRRLEEVYAARGADRPEQAARQLLEDVHDHAGLLLERGPGEYGFIHLTFQEYLAAVAIAQRGQSVLTPVVETLSDHVGDDNWHEVSLLAVGYVGLIQQRDEAAGAVATGLAGSDAGPPGEAVALAGEAVVDVWPGGVDAGAKQAVVAKLEDAAADADRVKAPLRAASADLLAKLGVVWPPSSTIEGMELCYVPAGAFWMGEEEEAHHCKALVRPYWITRYPITNAQFREFVAAGGYGEPAYWGEAAEAAFWRDGRFKGRYEDEFRDGPMDYGEPYNLANHPAVGVSWYECLAFTRWLTRQLRSNGWIPDGWQVRLPSEAEWEKAARGGDDVPEEPLVERLADLRQCLSIDECVSRLAENPQPKRTYPWGHNKEADEPDSNRANYDDTGIDTTSAVGCFPNGASPYGCQDMAGNVWEWTRSLYADYPYPESEEDRNERENVAAAPDSHRVLRGGAFYDFSRYVRCAFRGRYLPYARHHDIGFRLSLSPFLDSDL